MERISFNIAKALKKAGYPQRFVTSFGWYDKNGRFNDSSCDVPMSEEDAECVAPTYLEVWLWLFNERNIIIEPKCRIDDNGEYYWENGWIDCTYYDAEEAIAAAIEHLVDNNKI